MHLNLNNTVSRTGLTPSAFFVKAKTPFIGYDQLDKIIDIDQSPIGRTPRSNPATYTGVFDQIRELFAMTKDAKAKGYNLSLIHI